MFARSRWWLAVVPTLEDVTAAFKVLGMQYNPRRPPADNPTSDVVRKQYRQLAQLHHPDLSSGSDQQMTVINTAYELIQSSGVLQNTYGPALEAYRRANGASSAQSPTSAEGSADRFQRKGGSLRRRVPDDFASGDDAAWSMKSTLEWQTMIQSADNITEQELRNPANHPFSHSKFFSFEDDASIYRMIRGGATVKQVGRTLGKPATFIERRLQNAQFKQRIQYLLREERRHTKDTSTSPPRHVGRGKGTKLSDAANESDAEAVRAASPVSPNVHHKAVRTSAFDPTPPWSSRATADADARAGPHHAPRQFRTPRSTHSTRKREWEPSYPEWRAPQYFDDLSLEEKGVREGLVRDVEGEARADWTRHEKPAASKMGRSYGHYKRLRGNASRRPSL